MATRVERYLAYLAGSARDRHGHHHRRAVRLPRPRRGPVVRVIAAVVVLSLAAVCCLVFAVVAGALMLGLDPFLSALAYLVVLAAVVSLHSERGGR